MMVRLVSQTFRSIKPHTAVTSKSELPVPSSPDKSGTSIPKQSSWCVYLILSTNPPIKTYVGVTADFSRRGMNGENPVSSYGGHTRYPTEEGTDSSLQRSFCSALTVWFGVTCVAPVKCLKQHNGELKGGAKASRAGRPWVCACLIQGFMDKSKAYSFESKWKICSRKLPRKEKRPSQDQHIEDDPLPLLRHRHTALERVKGLIDCSDLEIVWKQDLS